MIARNMKKRILSGITAGFLLFLSASCAALAQESADEDAAEGATGRYLETEISAPGDGAAQLRDIVRLTDGSLRVIADGEGSVAMWDSADGGETWEQAAALPQQYAEAYYTELVLCADGGGAGIAMVRAGEWDAEPEDETAADYEYYFVSFDAEGNAQHTLFQLDYVVKLEFLRDGSLLCLTAPGDAYALERRTGEEVLRYGSGNDVMGVCGGEVFFLLESEVQRFDAASGEPLPRDEALDEALYSGGAQYIQTSSAGWPILFAQDDDGRLYYCTAEGIFSHVMDGGVVEQAVDGALNSLSDPARTLVAMEIADRSFYVICTDSMGRSDLMKFSFDEDIASVPERELTVWSLEEDAGIRQMAILFQKEHPDIYVNFETAMSGTDGVTASDALRTLNTELLSGNGPDVLILDGASVESYAEKGVLADLSGVLAQVKEEDGLFENIAYAYRDSDDNGNTVPAVPLRFGIPLAAGETALLERLTDLQSLAELQKEGALNFTNVLCLPELLYAYEAPAWQQEDGMLDRAALEEYVHTVNEIYGATRDSLQDTEREMFDAYRLSMQEIREEMGELFTDIGTFYLQLMDKSGGLSSARLCAGTLFSIDNYSGLVSALRLLEDCSLTTWSGGEAKVFVPVGTVGVNASSPTQEDALAFVSFLLSEESASATSGKGFPVNAAAFHSVLHNAKWGEGDGPTYSWGGTEEEALTFSWPNDEELVWLEETAESLTVCADSQRVLREVVSDEVWRCLDGQTSETETVDAIMQRMNLYLME